MRNLIDSTASPHSRIRALELPVYLIASSHFDELRRLANVASQVTFSVIYSGPPA